MGSYSVRRASDYKERIVKLLEKIYGRIEVNYKFSVGVFPEDFENFKYYDRLKEIYEALQEYRRFNNFIRSRTLPNCDYFLSNPGFVLEFDESQHFTFPRKITLERYPEDLKLGFNREEWIRLCERINRHDNYSSYRDEQRAWYDTLRDFLPEILGLRLTVRLYETEKARNLLEHLYNVWPSSGKS